VAHACFLAAGVESLVGSALDGVADLVTVTFPWASLLQGVLGLAPPALAGIAAILAPAGRLEVLTSVVPSDGVAGVSTLTGALAPGIESAWADAGLTLEVMRPATTAEITGSGSSWARRLLAGSGRSEGVSQRERVVWHLAGRRVAADSVPWATTSGSAAR
jgi:16S rRNA (adenine(1408)-N(1))-methyltransferase